MIEAADLAALEAAVQAAFAAGDGTHLRVLGYGEISPVVAWPTEASQVAAKRLPLFPDTEAADTYERAVVRYLARLADAGIPPVPTSVHRVPGTEREPVLYCIQPVLDSATIGPRCFSGLDEDEASRRFALLCDRMLCFVGPQNGLDGQLSNWVWQGDGFAYLDVSTPLMRDETGLEVLDTDLFLASLPWALRGLVRRFLLGAILDKYYDRRSVLLDFLGNLHKERLAHLVPSLLEVANARLERPIDETEALRYYRADARMWALLQHLRHLDRAWQRWVRRRAYPFLLPGPIER